MTISHTSNFHYSDATIIISNYRELKINLKSLRTRMNDTGASIAECHTIGHMCLPCMKAFLEDAKLNLHGKNLPELKKIASTLNLIILSLDK